MIKRLFLVLIVLIGLPLVFVVVVNLRDEPLQPDAAAFMDASPAKVAAEQNAFYYVAGFEAPLADDPYKAGKAWVEAVDAAQQKLLSRADAPWPAQPRGLPKIEAYCIPEKSSCIRWLKESTEGRPALSDNAAIVKRYRRVLSYPAYAEATDPRLNSYPLLRYEAFANAQRFLLLDVADRLDRGEIDAALAALRDEIAFDRRMLAGSRSMLHKMVAAAQLRRATVFAADALRTYRREIGPRAALLAEVLRPLSADERALTPTLRTELVVAASTLDPVRWRPEEAGLPIPPALLGPFYQYRATVNMIFRVTRTWADIDNSPATDLGAALLRVKETEPQFSLRRVIYNPVGKLLVLNNLPQIGSSFERLHDSDAMVRLVGLQAEVVAQDVQADDIPAFSKKFVDPYTGKPFAWDAAARQLSFEPHNQNIRDQKIGGTAGRVAVAL